MLRKTFASFLIALAAITFASARATTDDDDRDDYRHGLRVIGLTSDGKLIRFNSSNPRKSSNIGTVTGITGTLIGIDYRVQNGLLYGVSTTGGIYTIDTSTGFATFINALTVALNGTSFGVDFNPAANALRIVSNTGQNLRYSFVTNATFNDGTLTYTAPPAAPVAAPGIVGAAYTNNDLDANTATTLFNIDSNLDQVVIQSPANTGVLVATGKLGLDASSSVGFDIYSSLNRDGVTVSNTAFAAITAAGSDVSRFYSIDLLTGYATFRGTFRRAEVVDIAIPLDQ